MTKKYEQTWSDSQKIEWMREIGMSQTKGDGGIKALLLTVISADEKESDIVREYAEHHAAGVKSRASLDPVTFGNFKRGDGLPKAKIFRAGAHIGFLTDCGAYGGRKGFNVEIWRHNRESKRKIFWGDGHGSALPALEAAQVWAAREADWATPINPTQLEAHLEREYKAHMEALNEGQWG